MHSKRSAALEKVALINTVIYTVKAEVQSSTSVIEEVFVLVTLITEFSSVRVTGSAEEPN